MQPFIQDVRAASVELRNDYRSTVHYLLEPEVHVYSFSIAANVILAFYPFMLVMISLFRHLFHWGFAEQALYVAISDYFPHATGDFLARNLSTNASETHHIEWISMLLLLFTANGVFLPLEVALNRAWSISKGRNLVMNQVVSSALIFICGALVIFSAWLTGSGQVLWSAVFGANSTAPPFLLTAVFKLASIPITILVLFLIYWMLPNTKVPARLILPRAAVIGLALEALKWISLLISPWLFRKFTHEYGVFVHTVTILTWSFFASLIVLAGADWSARRARLAQWHEETAGAAIAPPPTVSAE